MAHVIRKVLLNPENHVKIFARYLKRRVTGKPPGEARSLEQRLKEINSIDPETGYKVNIGFAMKKLRRRDVSAVHSKILMENRNNPELERKSRNIALNIPLEEVEEEWSNTIAPYHIKDIAEHYAIFEHLFGDAYFYPLVRLNIDFKTNDRVVPAYWGNVIKPEEAKTFPDLSFTSQPDSLWTVVMSTPDGHFSKENGEYCHWFIGNIKGGNVKSGECIFEYMQPLPLQGLGYLRYIFILYKQEELLDYSDLKIKQSGNTFEERTFSTFQFYKERQQKLTPAGLCFFTADWDQSVADYYHNNLYMDIPKFHYDFPEHYLTKQKWFPLKQPFNLYLDRYRDQKQIAKEYLVKKLRATDPFQGSKKSLLYPNAVPFKKNTPSWLKNEIIKERLGLARAKDYL